MAFIDDIKPLLPVFLRLVAIWVEIVVFSMALISIMGVITFVPTGVLLILDITITAIRFKAKRTARQLGDTYEFVPKIWVICVDFFFTAAFIAFWSTHSWGLGENFYGWMVDSYVLTGELVIAHLHLFFASSELHILRQRKNGAAAARRAEQKDQAKIGVELTTTPVREPLPESSRV